MNLLFKTASKIGALPGLNMLSPSANRAATEVDLAGYRSCQKLAQDGAREIAGMIREGWTERQTADLFDTWLQDSGVKGFFHKSFVWFGERTRFIGVKNYFDYLPSERVVRPGEVFILDVAPILKGYICDIGYTSALGKNEALAPAQAFLGELRQKIPALFAAAAAAGGDVWRAIDDDIRAHGYDNIHATYPFSVLGHRVHRVKSQKLNVAFINFGWQSYWEFLSRGLFGQLLNENYHGNLHGLWAIEPHVGGADFGAKFEEILVVDQDGARWLGDAAL